MDSPLKGGNDEWEKGLKPISNAADLPWNPYAFVIPGLEAGIHAIISWLSAGGGEPSTCRRYKRPVGGAQR